MIYHIAKQSKWNSLLDNEFYLPDEFNKEGFIHCSEIQQIQFIIKEKFNNNLDGYLILEIDPTKLVSKTVYENLSGGKEKYPHIYGNINKSAIVKIYTESNLNLFIK